MTCFIVTCGRCRSVHWTDAVTVRICPACDLSVCEVCWQRWETHCPTCDARIRAEDTVVARYGAEGRVPAPAERETSPVWTDDPAEQEELRREARSLHAEATTAIRAGNHARARRLVTRALKPIARLFAGRQFWSDDYGLRACVHRDRGRWILEETGGAERLLSMDEAPARPDDPELRDIRYDLCDLCRFEDEQHEFLAQHLRARSLAEDHVVTGRICLLDGEDHRAASELERALAIDPALGADTTGELYELLGVARFKSRKFPEASKAFSEAANLSRDPTTRARRLQRSALATSRVKEQSDEK